jgi:hypothetical protein
MDIFYSESESNDTCSNSKKLSFSAYLHRSLIGDSDGGWGLIVGQVWFEGARFWSRGIVDNAPHTVTLQGS